MDRSKSAVGLALALLLVAFAGGAEGDGGLPGELDGLTQAARRLAREAASWYARTPPAERVAWGGLAAAAWLGLIVMVERTARLRRRNVLPTEFTARFLGRLKDGKIDRGKALDFCELNPSPAARVALAAVVRWGRPTVDLERAVAMTHRVEVERLRRHVGTLRRVAALVPLLGLFGTLAAAGRALAALGTVAAGSAPGWGPALADALSPLTAGVALAILALIAYDGLAGRVETLANALDRAGAETIDAIAMSLNPDTPIISARTPHQIRMDIPKPVETDE
jgi:biopolymer transport protein ExbB